MLIALLLTSSAASAADWNEQLKAAKPGTVITLPAGVFPGGITLPSGVGMRGAGVGQTFIDGRGHDVGVIVTGGAGASVSDLTIRDAAQTDLQIGDAQDVAITRVRTTGSMTGLVMAGVKRGRIENCLSDANRYGFVVSGGEDVVVVNCTAADDSSLGFSFPSGRRTIAFNNCVAHSATGVYVGNAATELQLDHNLYASLFVGKLEGQVGRKAVGEWTALSGQDAHAVEQPVTFRDARAGDYRPINALTWALDRAATSEWGHRTFAGAKAPAEDIDGHPRGAHPSAGAYEVTLTAEHPADGSFTVKSGEGITSAGIFTRAGREVAYLFHNLPLHAGEHQFWFPSRDFEGQPIVPAEYEVRTVESALDWQYMGMVGNNGLETPVGASAAVGTAHVTFDDDGQVITACDGWAENFVNLRAYDVASGKWHWAFHAPADVRGVARGADGMIYALRLTGKQERLTRVDPKTGKVAPWARLGTGELYLHTGAQPTGLTELDGKLFFTDTAAGKVFASPEDQPAFAPIADVLGAASPAADAAHHVLWLITGGQRVIALGADGKVVAEATQPVDAPLSLAARDGRLAITSASTGKIHLFDCSDPKHLKPLGTIGRGDGPFGAFEPDRFTFQRAENFIAYAPSLAMGPGGMIAVGDRNRLGLFDASGKILWQPRWEDR